MVCAVQPSPSRPLHFAIRCKIMGGNSSNSSESRVKGSVRRKLQFVQSKQLGPTLHRSVKGCGAQVRYTFAIWRDRSKNDNALVVVSIVVDARECYNNNLLTLQWFFINAVNAGSVGLWPSWLDWGGY